MTVKLEGIVRPFQEGDVFNARVLAPAQPPIGAAEVVVLSVTGSAEAKWIAEPDPTSFGITVSWEEDKSRRVSEKVRVENPDDSTQYVEIERIKQMVFKNRGTGQELPLKMDWS